MSGKIVFIDGHSILNRAFYGLPDLTASGGRHTGAVYGFLNILFKILEEEAPDYLTDPDKLECYFVCMDVKVHEGIEQDYMTKDGHRDQLFVLVQVDGNWYIAYSTIMFEMDGYDLDSFHNYTPDPS